MANDNMLNILMLTGTNNKTFFLNRKKNTVLHYVDVYTKGMFVRFFRHFSLFVYFILGSWKKNIQDYDIIFCIDSNLTLATLKWISKHRGNARIILYFRNKFYEKKNRWFLHDLKKLPIEIWSYNLHDCEKYGFRYNSQVLNKDFFKGLLNKKVKYSVAFVGANKGRKEIAAKIVQKVRRKNLLETYIYMTDAGQEEWNQCKCDNVYLPYSKYLEKVSESMAVLDLVSPENMGLTFRPLEAMFLKKKLITNYTEITRYDFYSKENVFILGVDDWDDLCSFLNSPYKEIPECIIQSYTTDFWMKRFIDCE